MEDLTLDRGLSAAVDEDHEMEEDEDEDEDDKFLSKYFKKRFLVKRKRMNGNDGETPVQSIEESLADNDGFCYGCISAGITEPLIKKMKKFLDNIPFMRTVSWVIGQMSHLKDSPLFKETAWDLFPALWELAKNEDSEVCINAVWGLGYLTEGDIDLLMNFDKNIIKTVAPYLISSNSELQIATLHFFANCAAGNDEITQKIVDCGVLKNLNEFLNHKNVEVVRETVWMLSNILAGTEKQIKAVFDAGLMPKIIELLESFDKNVAEKALWAVTNVPLCGNPELINLLTDLNVISSLCTFLKSDKNQILETVVEAINKIQQNCSNRKGKIRQSIINSGNSVERLRELQNHYSETIEMNATRILTDILTK
uniref:Uncharacterized protein n=1 Tax=Panagrolaimus davidi TaxID=227884 RepID=A0A914PHW6_9BILA